MTAHDKPPTKIHFSVDNEPFTTEQSELTPDFIIKEYGEKDPVQNYLVQIHGHEEISYKGKGTVPIPIKNGDRFQVVSVGPTPVSDPAQKFGVAAFIAGLTELGFNASLHGGSVDRVVLDYEVPTGRFAGKQVKLGFIVPPDFPMSPPTGPHVSPHIWPLNPNAQHPQRAHQSDQFGGDWQYWSRPVPDWAKGRTVAAYMAHIWRLWHTQ
jgi:hypothetical protein